MSIGGLLLPSKGHGCGDSNRTDLNETPPDPTLLVPIRPYTITEFSHCTNPPQKNSIKIYSIYQSIYSFRSGIEGGVPQYVSSAGPCHSACTIVIRLPTLQQQLAHALVPFPFHWSFNLQRKVRTALFVLVGIRSRLSTGHRSL